MSKGANSLWTSDAKWHHKTWVNIASGGGLLSDGTITWTGLD